MINAYGTGQRQLTETGVIGHFLRWSEDGRSVIFKAATGEPNMLQVPHNGGTPAPFAQVTGGSHMSFSPDFSRAMDVSGHRVLWLTELTAESPVAIFEFADTEIRIDYPVWSPNGKWVLFDRFQHRGGDIWLLENFN